MAKHPHSRWTWLKTGSKAPIDRTSLYRFGRAKLFGMFSDGFTVFGPYRRPILDATGGGELYARQLNPFSSNMVMPQQYTPVSIAGDGAELTGQYQLLGLVNVTNSNGNAQSI